MLQLINKSPFLPVVSVLPDRAGIETLYVVVKGTFTLEARPAPAAQQVAPHAKDVYCGEPGASSLKYASEVHVGKAGTDVVLVGSARSPNGRPVTEMLAAVEVAGRRKVVRVVGDRTWRGRTGGFWAPAPFSTMPLVYERAFGGTHDDGRGSVAADERNPVGVGFRGRRSIHDVAGQRLPNLEDPLSPIAKFGDQPPPAGFGFVAPSWLPRRAYAGTYDDAWKTTRAPFLPDDFDPRFDNAAPPDLAFDRFLVGGEPMKLHGVCDDALLELSVPGARPRIEVAIAGDRELPEARLETILIEPDERRLCLTWRAALPCDKRALKVQSITIEGGQ
jgi:hypothetical protein